MYKVLIAEDSKPILRNIKQLIERSELPLEVVHTAFNGEDALSYMSTHPLDILLTDIRMPKLDGLSLIEQAKQYHPELNIVLISSYSDFEYTRKAITLQVFDYLLKPVEQQQLNDVLSRLLSKLEDIRQARFAMLGDIVTEHWMLERLGDQQAFYDQPKLMMLLSSQPFTSKEKWQYELVEPIISACCAPYSNWLLPLKHSKRLLLLCSVSLRDKLHSGTAWMKLILEHLLQAGIHASATCHYEPVEPKRIYTTYVALESTMNEQLALFRPTLIELEHTQSHVQQRSIDDALRTLQDYIVHWQKEQYSIKLSELLKQWKDHSAAWSELEQLLVTIEGAFNEAWHHIGLAPEESSPEPVSLMNMLNLEDYNMFCKQLLAWSDGQFQLLQSYNRKSGEELFQQLDQYILQNLYNHLSINDLALKYHISPSYVSRIMKRYTGQTFVQYFMNLKIKEACHLMQTKPSLKIRELSDALAFSDQHYFSRVFKEYTGCTPSEYKSQYVTNES